jgi:hypothetical protein
MAGMIRMQYIYKIVTRYCMDSRTVQMSDSDRADGWKLESWQMSAGESGCYIAMELCKRVK